MTWTYKLTCNIDFKHNFIDQSAESVILMDKLIYFLGKVKYSLVIDHNGHWKVWKLVKNLGLESHDSYLAFDVYSQSIVYRFNSLCNYLEKRSFVRCGFCSRSIQVAAIFSVLCRCTRSTSHLLAWVFSANQKRLHAKVAAPWGDWGR